MSPAKRPLSAAHMSHATPAKAGSSSSTPGPAGPSGSGSASRMDLVRRASIDSEREGEAKKKRISLSCAQCAKRKQKCNREFPCNHCVARKVPELCVPYNPAAGNSVPGSDPMTNSRLDRIETVLSFVVRHHGGLWGYRDVKDWMQASTFQRLFPSSPSGTPRPYPDIDTEREVKPTLRLGTKQDPPTANAQDGFTMEQSTSVGGDEERLERLGELEGLPESMQERGKVNIKHDIHGTPAENLQQLIRECGMSPHKIAELVQELPPKQLADKIIDWFFIKLNFARYPIDERSFRESYEDLYRRSTAVDPSNVRALPLVFIVLALAVRLAPEEWAGDDQTRKLSSLRMYWSSRRSILVATAVQSESIELVLSRLLSAMYLVTIHDRRLTECWSQLGASLRTAQAIGLHRDGAKLGLDPHQAEYRRRIWSYLYHADKLYSLVLGRPPSISDSYTDTLPPSNIDLSSFSPSTPAPQPLPLTQPTTATFLILRRSLSSIIGNVVHHFQKLDEPAKYADVEALQVELDRFIDGLPAHFRMYDPDKGLDETLFWLPVHRFSLLSEIIMTTIILHVNYERPWLLRKLSSNRYAASRTSCFEMAKLDFSLRQEHYKSVPDHRVYQSQGQFKMFNSAMIAGISAIIDPRGPDGDTMRKILGTFLELNPWGEVKDKDETTRKEVRIIQTLSRRAGQIYENSFAPGELSPPEKDSVDLLLGLRGEHAPPLTPYIRPGTSFSALGGGLPSNAGPNGGKGWASLMNNNPRLNGQAYHSPGSSVHEDDSQRMLDHWLNANSSLAVGSLTGPFPLDPMVPSTNHSGMYIPIPPPPQSMSMAQQQQQQQQHGYSLPGTPIGPGPNGQMPWDSTNNLFPPPPPPPPPPMPPPGHPLHIPNHQYNMMPTPTPTGPGQGQGQGQGMAMQMQMQVPPLMSMGPPTPGIFGGYKMDLPHGHGHGHGHVPGDLMFSQGPGVLNQGGLAGLGGMSDAAAFPSLGVGMGMGMGMGGGENADEYWNALIDGILGTTSTAGAGQPQ